MTDDPVMLNITTIEDAEDFVRVFADIVAEYGTRIPKQYIMALNTMAEEVLE